MKDAIDFHYKRMEDLKQKTILKDSEFIDYNQKKNLYDSLLKNVITGEFDYVYSNDFLKGLTDEDKDSIFQLTRKYISLLFYDGEFDTWMDSITGVTAYDLELICVRILDDYDFLLELADGGGEGVLQFLMDFKDSSTEYDGSIIDCLRSYYLDDAILKTILIEMSKQDGLYHGLTKEQKIIMCNNPDGVLFKKTPGGLELVSGTELNHCIQKQFLGKIDKKYENFEDLSKLFSTIEQFADTILGIVVNQ